MHRALLLSDPQAAFCALYTHTAACTHVHTRHTDMAVCMSKHMRPTVGTHVTHYKHTHTDVNIYKSTPLHKHMGPGHTDG